MRWIDAILLWWWTQSGIYKFSGRDNILLLMENQTEGVFLKIHIMSVRMKSVLTKIATLESGFTPRD